MDIEFYYLKDEVPQSLIDECENLCLLDNKTYFIFDNLISNRIKLSNTFGKEDKRDIIIEQTLNEDVFHIGDDSYFHDMSSRFSYYDTQTKLVGRYNRYKFVYDFIIKLGFLPSDWNLGPEYEQTFSISDYYEKWILRLSPNLFIKIDYEDYKSQFPGSKKVIYNNFFNMSLMLRSLELSNIKFFKSKVREIKLEKLIGQ
jgi:hypothetical protein